MLLGMVKSGQLTSRVLLILGNLGSCAEGQAALLDSGGVECLVRRLREETELDESTWEGCVAVLYCLSYSGLRFKGLAKAASAVEVLVKVRAEQKRAGEGEGEENVGINEFDLERSRSIISHSLIVKISRSELGFFFVSCRHDLPKSHHFLMELPAWSLMDDKDLDLRNIAHRVLFFNVLQWSDPMR